MYTEHCDAVIRDGYEKGLRVAEIGRQLGEGTTRRKIVAMALTPEDARRIARLPALERAAERLANKLDLPCGQPPEILHLRGALLAALNPEGK